MEAELLFQNETVGKVYRVRFSHRDLTAAVADADQTLPALSVKAGQLVQVLGTRITEGFEDASDTAFNSTVLKIGDGAAIDRFLKAQELNVNGTEVLGKAGEAAGYVYLADDTVDLTIESMAAKSLVNIDKGEGFALIRVIDLPAFDPVG